MYFSHLSVLSLALSVALACNPPDNLPRQDSNSTSYPQFTVGNDGPADPATIGYSINHLSFIVNNLTKSHHFYGTILGMRTIFRYDTSKDFAIMYMGHSQGGKNGTGFQTGVELMRDKNNLGGLLELLEVKSQKKKREFQATASNTLSHLGLIVPDINATQARLESFGVPIIKPVGEKPSLDRDSIIAKAFGFDDPTSKEAQEALPGIVQLGFTTFIVAADPDGNLLEIQQQDSEAV
ncbi:hypothetical protein K469DRAFT_692707 [Zopfia rhizophila CBS 207.26]|uniref:VOC domain-containing protein n=1 Tax=Zopfia rhizophila CBS 207.26 TaxID=1314779 RepID=A0A6A6DN67_9PEZI|nr:hypothetical protein K469DRAFT_692707 [Zopfia rhizophila CBS 207.26]